MSGRRRIAVAMSGGVDSSVAAALLRETGEDIFGLMLRLTDGGEGKPNRCCTPDDVAAAQSLASNLGMPFYVVDARQAFEERVILPFVRDYAQGVTPNPCVECNLTIRFGFLLERALALGATHLATGHYARIERSGATVRLLAARDPAKDQSYVLHALSQDQLSYAVFPLAALTKDDVRDHARRMQLAVAERRESQDLCFVHGDYRSFLAAHGIRAVPGPIVDRQWRVLGTHSGLSGFTLGQRKGLGLAAPRALYVLDKDVAHNALIVGYGEEVGRQEFTVTRANWIAGNPPSPAFEASVQVRYHAPRVEGRVTCTSPGEALVRLATRHPDVAPGQCAVFYDGEVCLGGGIIRL